MKLSSFFDPFFIVSVIGLSGISLFLLVSTAPDLLPKQGLFIVLGLLLMVVTASIDIQFWSRFRWILYVLSVFFLLSSYLAPAVRGANRWIEVGAFNIQPSELLKPLMILIFSSFLAKRYKDDLFTRFMPIILFLPIAFLVLKQPDLGNTLVYLAFFIGLGIYAGIPWSYLFSFFAFSAILLPFFWLIMKDYQKLRVITFLDPYQDPIGAGYNAIQSAIAVGSGQLFGLGLGKGTQSSLLFLPEYHTDFAFASLVESLGFIGGVMVIIFYIILLLRILQITMKTQTKLESLVCIGVFTQLFIQIVINIGMNLGILPVTGITLPLVSYGGSSVVSTFFSLGLVISILKKNYQRPLVIR